MSASLLFSSESLLPSSGQTRIPAVRGRRVGGDSWRFPPACHDDRFLTGQKSSTGEHAKCSSLPPLSLALSLRCRNVRVRDTAGSNWWAGGYGSRDVHTLWVSASLEPGAVYNLARPKTYKLFSLHWYVTGALLFNCTSPVSSSRILSLNNNYLCV